jgi:4-amino-4-deoxy-L-arabinose transferase-like glycosyltransferase
MRSRSWAFALAVIALLGLVIRVAYVLKHRAHHVPMGDDFYYHAGANLLVEGHGFIEPFWFSALHISQPAATHPPLWILVLAVPSAVGLKSFTAHQIWSCVVGLGTVVATSFAGRRLAGKRVGLVAAGIAAVYPNFWLIDGAVMSETLALGLTALTLLIAYRFWRHPDVPSAIWLGVICALQALNRAEMLLLLPLLGLLLPLLARSIGTKRRVMLGTAAVGAAVVTLLPWSLYNLSRFERPELLSNGFGPALVISNCDATFSGPLIGFWSFDCIHRLSLTGLKGSLPPGSSGDPNSVLSSMGPGFPPGDVSEGDYFFRDAAFTYMRQHLARLPAVIGARVGRTWGLFHPSQQEAFDISLDQRPRIFVRAGLLMYYALVIISIVGALSLRRRGVTLVPFLALFVAVTLAVSFFYANTRFRAPAEVCLAILAAVGIDALAPRVSALARRLPIAGADSSSPNRAGR